MKLESTNTYDASSMSVEKLQETFKRIAPFMREHGHPISHPLVFMGMNFNIMEVRRRPRIQWSDKLEMSEDLRQKLNAELVEMFGYIDETPIPRGTIYYMHDNAVIRRDDYATLISILTV